MLCEPQSSCRPDPAVAAAMTKSTSANPFAMFLGRLTCGPFNSVATIGANDPSAALKSWARSKRNPPVLMSKPTEAIKNWAWWAALPSCIAAVMNPALGVSPGDDGAGHPIAPGYDQSKLTVTELSAAVP